MNKLLIKLSKWINKKCGISPEIDDLISFQGSKFRVVNTIVEQEVGCFDTITITAYGGFDNATDKH